MHIGEPLVEFEGDDDSGTVVGKMKVVGDEQGNEITSPINQHHFIIGGVTSTTGTRLQLNATPAIRALADRLSVDLNQVKPSGAHQLITSQDVEKAHQRNAEHGSPNTLKGVARFMAKNMARAHAQVAQVSIFDDANISHWQNNEDLLVKVTHAIAFACKKEPKLNAVFS